MAHTFTVELTDVELKGLEYVAVSANDWIQNAVKERCRMAIEELVQAHIADALATGKPLSGTKEEMVLTTTLKSARERNEEMLAKIQAETEASGGATP